MGNPDAKRLYDDLLSNYNKLVRPVQNTTDPLTVRIKLKLSQLIDVVSILELQTKVREDFTIMEKAPTSGYDLCAGRFPNFMFTYDVQAPV